MDKPSSNPIDRVEYGLFAPGKSANPGGRPSYPDWFRGKLTQDALEYLGQLVRGEAEDSKVSRGMACLEVINRVIGRPKDVSEDGGASATNGLDAIVELLKAKKADASG